MIITEQHLSGIAVTEGQLNQVLWRLTPPELLAQTDFEKAFPIVLDKFPTFSELLKHSENIQHLCLLPVKNDAMRAKYKELDKSQLAIQLKEKIGNNRFMLAKNEYEYLAPPTTQQLLLWVNDRNESHCDIAEFIAKCLIIMRVPVHRVILFERPSSTTTLMVKGTFPQMRHIHLWFSFNQIGN
jgi:hypothetical protein